MSNALAIIDFKTAKRKEKTTSQTSDEMRKIYVASKSHPRTHTRSYSFLKEIMKPEKEYIRQQKEAIERENEIKLQAFMLANHVSISKVTRKFSNVINTLMRANKPKRRWF